MAPAPTYAGAPHRRRALIALTGALSAGLVLSGALIWRGTSAVWTADTRNDANTFVAGNLSLSDNDSNGALFNLSGLLPGESGEACINVSYDGNGSSVPVRLYAENLVDSDSLSTYLDLTVETIDYTPGGTPLDCSAGTVSNATTVYDATTPSASAATVEHFAGLYQAYASGLPVWTANTSEVQGFRFSYTLQGATPDTEQGATTTLNFVWETQVGS